MVSYSVIIPVLNGVQTLSRTLRALGRQTMAPDEVIVADGLSSDGTADMVRDQFPEVRIVHNPLVHAAGGRNAALRVANGEWCCFTDADCVPADDWLWQIDRKVQQLPEAVGFAGRVNALPPRNLIEEVSSGAILHKVLGFGDEPGELTGGSLRQAPITANAAYQKAALDRVNGFDNRFSNYAEDLDLYLRVVAAGLGSMWYEPTIRVSAQHPATLGSMAKKWQQYGMASCYLQRYHFGRLHYDWRLHKAALHSLWLIVADSRDYRRHGLEVFQIVNHLCGKWRGSVRLGVVNL